MTTLANNQTDASAALLNRTSSSSSSSGMALFTLPPADHHGPADPSNDPALLHAQQAQQTEVNAGQFTCLWAPAPNTPCLRRFVDPDAFYAHLAEEHVGRKSHGNLSLNCMWMGCSHGDRPFSKRDHIVSHCRAHVPFKANVCQDCGAQFKWPQDLKKHCLKQNHTFADPAQRTDKPGTTSAFADPESGNSFNREGPRLTGGSRKATKTRAASSASTSTRAPSSAQTRLDPYHLQHMQMQQIQMQQMQMHPQMSQFHQTSQQQLPINAANASPNSSAIGALLSLREQPAGGMQEYGNYNSGYSVQPFSGQGGSFGQGQYGYSQNVYQQQPPLHTYQSMQQQQQQQQQNLIMNTHSPLLNNNAGSYSSTGNLNVQNLINSHPATPFHGQTIQFASTPHLLNTHSGNNNTFAIPQPTFKQTPLHTNSNYTAIADQRQSIATNPAFSPLPPNSTSTGGLLAAMSPNVIITAAPARTATLRAPTSISALASPNVHRMHPYRKSSALTPVVSGPASAHALLTMMSPLPPAAPNTDMGIDMSRVVNSPFLNNPPSAANQQSTGFMATAPQEFLERERAVAFLMQPSPYMQQAVAQARRAEADILASVDGVLGEGVAGAVGSVGAAGVDVMRAFGDAGEFGSGGVGDLF